RMTSGDCEGWGETTPFFAPTYSPETASTVFVLNQEVFCPALVGRDFETAEDLLDALKVFKGNPFAKAGPESAWWDLKARREGQPLHRLLGGERKVVDAGSDFGVQDTLDMLLQKIQGAIDRGFKRTKLKVRPGWDLEMLKLVRSTFPRHTFHIDCNSGYALSDLPFFRAVDRLGLAMIEQPLFHRDLLDHAELQRQLDTPVCLDESVTSLRDFEQALQLKACRYLNIKYGRVGGISVARALHDRACDAGIPCWVGGMLESGVGAGLNVELASLGNFTYPADLFPSAFFYRQDLTEPELVLNPDCTFSVSAVPGTPYRPVLERVEAATLRKAVIRPS
ncbi:o-succinylbenzoate synthase, partial [bacterium]|nr:o-succinylbenzoate synthase [bacterium]